MYYMRYRRTCHQKMARSFETKNNDILQLFDVSPMILNVQKEVWQILILLEGAWLPRSSYKCYPVTIKLNHHMAALILINVSPQLRQCSVECLDDAMF